MPFSPAQAARIPVIDVDASGFADTEDKVEKKIDLIFSVAKKLKKEYEGCAIVFRNVNSLDELNDLTPIFYIDILKNFEATTNIFLFALCTSAFTVPPIVLQKNLFTTIITVDYPKLEVREQILEAIIKKNGLVLDDDVSIARLAKEAIGCTPQEIEYIIEDVILYSARQGHKKITQNDFSDALAIYYSGDKNFKMTEKYRWTVAYHEAGHVVAGYFSDPKYIVNRVEISPRSQGSLGITFSEVDENKYSYFRDDYENRIIHLLGGLCAEEVVYGKHTSGVVGDLTMATGLATNIVKAYGMEKDFGYSVVIQGVTDSWYNHARAEKLIKKIMDELYERCKKIISDKLPYLEALAKALVQNEVVLSDEIGEIFKNVAKELGDDDIFSNRSKEE